MMQGGHEMFTGKKVRLREVRKEDAELINKLGNEEEVFINLSTRLPMPKPLQVEENWYQEYTKEYNEDFIQFVIETLDGTVIGKCGTGHIDWKNSCVTIWIFIGNPENRSKGYGSDALSLLVNFIFREMNMNRVQLYVFAFNERAVTSYKKVGFVVEGVQKQELFRNGTYNDVYIMSILKREYDAAKGGDADAI
jgi:RimJ/RimL family protein N-acetyltransferase